MSERKFAEIAERNNPSGHAYSPMPVFEHARLRKRMRSLVALRIRKEPGLANLGNLLHPSPDLVVGVGLRAVHESCPTEEIDV
jgi:hypothetical protein